MKKGTALLVLLLCMQLLVIGDTEPNGTIAEANSLSLSTLHSGTIPVGDSWDFYQLTIPVDGIVSLTLDCSSSPLQARARIYNVDGVNIGTSSIATGIVSLDEDCIAAGTIYVGVERWSSNGSYTLQVSVSASSFANDAEPNDVITMPMLIAEDVLKTGHLGYVNGAVSPTDNNDWYVSILGGNGETMVTVNTTNGMQVRVWIFNASGSSLGSSIIGTSVSKTEDCVSADTIYFRVERWSGCGSYDIIYDHAPASFSNDNEPNDDTGSALSINEGAVRTGHLGYGNATGSTDNNDYYTTTLAANGMVEVTIIPTNGMQVRVWQYNSDGNSNGSSIISSDTIVYTLDCIAAGDYFFRAQRWSGCGSYALKYRIVEPSNPNDAEPNNSIVEAIFLNENQIKTGQLGYVNGPTSDNSDYYSTILSGDGKVSGTVTSSESLSARVWIYNKGGASLGTSSIGAGSQTIVRDCIAGDTLYFRVERWSGCGSYTFSHDLEEPTFNNDNEPNNTISEPVTLNPNILRQGHLGYLNANPVDNNDYYIFDSEASGNVTLIAIFAEGLTARIRLLNSSGSGIVTSSITSDTATITFNLPTNDDYVVRVERWSGCGSYSLKLENGCPRPKNLRTDPAISIGAILKWNAVGPASSYTLQKRLVGAPDWQPDNTLGIPKYTWFPLTSCTNYEFRVEATCGARHSSFSPVKQFQTLCSPVCFTPTGLTVVMTSPTTAQISWTGQPIDIGYRVQYVVDGVFGTIFEKTSTSSVIELTGLTPGTNYLFRVNAFCLDAGVSGFVYGAFSTTTVREGEVVDAGDPEIGLSAAVSGIELYPNPASTTVVVSLQSEDNLLEVVNAIGQVVMIEQVNGLRTQLDISGLEPGLYQIRATDAKGTFPTSTSLIIRR